MGMFYPYVILTKREKFNHLMDEIRDSVNVRSRFIGVYPNLLHYLNEHQKETLKELTAIYYNETLNRGTHDNGEHYQPLINRAYDFLKEILNLVPKPVTYANGSKMEDFEERYRFIYNPEHDGSHIGSACACKVDDGLFVTKLNKDEGDSLIPPLKVYAANRYTFTDWLAELKAGRYHVNGYRFDVSTRNITGEEYVNRILVQQEEWDNHPISKFILRNIHKDKKQHEECSTCRGGGCIRCEPQRFVVGYQH